MIDNEKYFLLDEEIATLMNGHPYLAVTESGKVWNLDKNEYLPCIFSRDTSYFITLLILNNGSKKMVKTKMIVANHFLPNPDNHKEVEPIDGNRRNHSANNLRWVIKDSTPEPSFWEKIL